MVDAHVCSEFYDVEGFKKGRSTLDKITLEGAGDVCGKSLLHLQCHFGLDTLSFARLSARVTGVDFSPKAIDHARILASELDIPATFVCSDLYDLADNLSGQYDIVFTSKGVLCWLPELEGWARVVSHFLKPGGFFFILESIPSHTSSTTRTLRNPASAIPISSRSPCCLRVTPHTQFRTSTPAILGHTSGCIPWPKSLTLSYRPASLSSTSGSILLFSISALRFSKGGRRARRASGVCREKGRIFR